MKYIFCIAFLLFAFVSVSSGQKISVENHDGRAVIVTRDTSETGEIKEVVEWVAEPKQDLQRRLQKASLEIESIERQLIRLHNRLSEKKQVYSDLQAAADALDKGIILETGMPGQVQIIETKEPTKKPKTKRNKKQ